MLLREEHGLYESVARSEASRQPLAYLSIELPWCAHLHPSPSPSPNPEPKPKPKPTPTRTRTRTRTRTPHPTPTPTLTSLDRKVSDPESYEDFLADLHPPALSRLTGGLPFVQVTPRPNSNPNLIPELPELKPNNNPNANLKPQPNPDPNPDP